MSSLEQAHDLPKDVDDMVRAWQRGDTAWFETRAQIRPRAAIRPFISRCWWRATASGSRESRALLDDDKNYLVIVGTAHLVGRDSVIDLLKKDGIAAAQR